MTESTRISVTSTPLKIPSFDPMMRGTRLSRRKFALLACIFLSSSSVPAGETNLTLPEVLAKIKQARADIHDLRFDFVQTVQQGHLKPQVITGELLFKQPGFLRINQRTPEKQRILTDGNTVCIYTPSQGQQLTGNWKEWLEKSRFPIALLNFVGYLSDEKWEETYQAFNAGYQDRAYGVTFKPRAADDAPLTLYFSDQTFLPTKGTMTNANLTLRIEIRRTRINQGLKGSLFAADVPANTQTISMDR